MKKKVELSKPVARFVPTIRMRLASEIAGDAKKLTKAINAWMGGWDKNRALLFLPIEAGRGDLQIAPTMHILVIESNNWRPKQITDLALFTRLSSRALSVAVESRQLERRMRRSSAVSEIAQNINTTLDIEILLRLIVLEVAKALNCQAGNIWLSNEKSGHLVMRVCMGLSDTLKAALENTLTIGKSWDKKNSMSVEVIGQKKNARAKLFQESGFQTILTIPLKTKNNVIGALQLFSKWPREFLKEEDDLLRTLANLAATAIDNAGLFKESQRKAQELLAVYEVGQAVSEMTSIDAALRHIVERVSEMLDVEKSWLMFFHEESQTLRAHPVAVGAVEEQLEALRIPIDKECISSIVYRNSRPMFSNDAREVPAVKEEFDGIFNLRNIMSVPMRGREETIGIFLAANKRKGALFTGSDVRLLKTLASAAGTVIQHANLYDKLKR